MERKAGSFVGFEEESLETAREELKQDLNECWDYLEAEKCQRISELFANAGNDAEQLKICLACPRRIGVCMDHSYAADFIVQNPLEMITPQRRFYIGKFSIRVGGRNTIDVSNYWRTEEEKENERILEPNVPSNVDGAYTHQQLKIPR